jgi:hypothetical protein
MHYPNKVGGASTGCFGVPIAGKRRSCTIDEASPQEVLNRISNEASPLIWKHIMRFWKKLFGSEELIAKGSQSHRAIETTSSPAKPSSHFTEPTIPKPKQVTPWKANYVIVGEQPAPPIKSAKKEDLEGTKKLLKDNPDIVFSKGWMGTTLLHEAASDGHADVARFLLANNAVINCKDNNGLTPLERAASNGHKEVAELLLANNAEVNVKDNTGGTPLASAALFGHKDVVNLLLNNGADVNAKENMQGSTPLFAAAHGGHTDVVELLLARGADVNAKDMDGRTPLHSAASQGHPEVVELLLQKGADVNARDNVDGATPLGNGSLDQLSARHKEVAKVLRTHGGRLGGRGIQT